MATKVGNKYSSYMNKKITLLKIFIGFTSLALIVGIVSAGKIFARGGDDDDDGGMMGKGMMRAENGENGRFGFMGGEMRKEYEHMNGEEDQENGRDAGESAFIKPNGDFRVRGATVNSVSTSTGVLNVSLFGFSKDVNVGSARLIGSGNSIAVSDIRPGDKLTGAGNFNETTRVLTVAEIRDVSFEAQNESEVKAKIQQLWDLIQKLQEQLKKVL